MSAELDELSAAAAGIIELLENAAGQNAALIAAVSEGLAKIKLPQPSVQVEAPRVTVQQPAWSSLRIDIVENDAFTGRIKSLRVTREK